MPADHPRLSQFEGVPLTPRALFALRRLVAACLAPDPAAATTASLREHWRQVPQEEWLAMIRRQRLVTLLQAHPVVADLLPSLPPALRQQAREERFAALALARSTCEIGGQFQQADLPVLVIKGVPLSLQTTGTITARGRSTDLDLWVDSRRLPDAIRLLQGLGFRRWWGEAPLEMDGLPWRYCRWIAYELSLQREQHIIDLHWALSHARGDLPSFAEAWQQREVINLQGHNIATLSRGHAFRHACAHAFKDQWRSLRDLIDIDRLACQLPVDDLRSLATKRSVRISTSAAHALTRSDCLTACSLKPQSRRYAAVSQLATVAQLRCQSVFIRESDEPWSICFLLANASRLLQHSADPVDGIRFLFWVLLPPRLFNDPRTGRDRGLGVALLRSLQRLTSEANSQPAQP